MTDELPRLEGIKRGSTFIAFVDYAIDGEPEVFPASDLTSQVRDGKGGKLADLTITSVSPGKFKLQADNTAGWPLGDAFFDVKRVSNGVTSFTQTTVIPVGKAQTQTE